MLDPPIVLDRDQNQQAFLIPAKAESRMMILRGQWPTTRRRKQVDAKAPVRPILPLAVHGDPLHPGNIKQVVGILLLGALLNRM